MKKIKEVIVFFVVVLSLVFLFGPETIPQNSQLPDFSKNPFLEEIIIIFNSGGWGNTPLERADDFNHIIKGIQETLQNFGYSSLVVPYQRANNGFFGKLTATKENLRFFQSQSTKLSREIEEVLISNPDKKIILAGLSNGAAFGESTMEKISDSVKGRVLAVEAGVPFWEPKSVDSGNVLRLDNQGNDNLADGRIKDLFFALIRTPGKWFSAKISGGGLPLARAFQAKGHYYQWDEVRPAVASFLENKLK